MSKPKGEEIKAVWRRPNGSIVSCHEKVKVLEDNYAELRQTLQDALDDGILLGCSASFLKEKFEQLLQDIQPTVAEDHQPKSK